MEVGEAASPPPPPRAAVDKANAVAVEAEAPGAAPAQRPARIGRSVAGERWVARVLRGGALISGAMFLGSLALEALPQSQSVHVAIDALRKSAASLLLVTPVARLVLSGAMLGLRGEWRYTLAAAGVLALLALAVSAGLHA
ncbi:MAG: hypothetical protein JXB05_09305 [Myxococcaceae bacterium]|nr:hypothetical protein [Myxococcaceae bacterium]